MLYPDDVAARRVIDEIAEETGLPTDDPVRFGGDRLWPAVRDAVEALILGPMASEASPRSSESRSRIAPDSSQLT
jgi:hypothetical protein